MRTLALVGLLAMVLVWPLSSHAQDNSGGNNNGWQLHDPNEYRQEDSHPIRAIASLLSPVGWALEWGIARPWHYVATQTFLAPVLNGGQDEDSWTEYYGNPGPMRPVPIPQTFAAPPEPREYSSSEQQPLRERNLGAPPASSSGSYPPAANSYSAPPSTSYSSTGSYSTQGAGANRAEPPTQSAPTQPALH
jgi:hypothetical protein